MKPVILHNSTFYNGDCIRGAARYIPANSVDLIITDPPYGINGDKLHQHYNRNEDFVVEGYVEISQKEYAEFSEKWIREAERVLRPGGSIYIVSGYTNLIDVLNALRKTTLKEINHIIWKYNFGVFTRQKYVSSHYHILFYEKSGGTRTFNLESRYGLDEKSGDNRSLNNTDREDVWIINREYKPGQIKNKNELPAKLLFKMIQYSSNEGDLVCDFFLGGFSTAKVALGLNRRVLGFEISRKMFDTKIKEIETLRPGCFIPSLRHSVASIPENHGKSWTQEDCIRLKEEYGRLVSKGTTKKELIAQLGEMFCRGRWSIEKALKKNGCVEKKRMAKKTFSEFT
ncbi:MAG: site-specific DNA-methyltransferase [Methanoregula sp.]|uniref:DNA-methyltransferase n=1 Tax=Methanoregula sp. TaxID=2052170 RepID=UPI003C74BB53